MIVCPARASSTTPPTTSTARTGARRRNHTTRHANRASVQAVRRTSSRMTARVSSVSNSPPEGLGGVHGGQAVRRASTAASWSRDSASPNAATARRHGAGQVAVRGVRQRAVDRRGLLAGVGDPPGLDPQRGRDVGDVDVEGAGPLDGLGQGHHHATPT